MSIGTITLFTALFFGGVEQQIFLDILEERIKQSVTEPSRSKEILADLKTSKKEIDAFDKDRRARLKEFYALNLDRDISYATLKEFFEKRMEERLVFQEKILSQRMRVVGKISEEEWTQIINLSNETVDKKTAKELNKNPKDLFKPVYTAVEKSIKEEHRMVQGTALVQNFETRYEELNSSISSINTRENVLLRDKITTRSQFKALAKEINDVRAVTYKALVDFHFDMLDVTEETEWLSIMKSMNKVLD